MYISDSSELQRLCQRAREVGVLGLDAEFIRERTYYPKLALVQLVVEDQLCLLDPLSDLDLAPLEALLPDPEIEKVLHAPAQDLEIFFNRTGELPRRIFDTQIAAAIIGLGNQISYGGLVERLLEVSLNKGESFTDWLHRPLSERQEEYALDDVRYLLPLRDALNARLEALGRGAWAVEEFRRYESRDLYVVDPETLYRRIRRANSLGGRGLAILQELALWREEEARRRDRPRRSVVPDEVLVELARSRPSRPEALSKLRGLHPREAKRSGRALIDAVQRGQSQPPLAVPRRSSRQLGGDGEAALELVQAAMRALCYRAEIAPVLLANNADLESLVLEFREGTLDPDQHEILRGWRRELIGDTLIAVLEGRVAVRIDPQTGVPTFDEV